MSQAVSTIMSHLSIGTNQFEKSTKFYDRLLSVLGAKRIMEHPGAVAWGKQFPEFWVQTPIDGNPATVGNGTHLGFFASSKAEVDAFYAAAREMGAPDEGKPGPRAEYGKPYYGCFVRDPDGHKIEATFWDVSLM